MDDPEANHETQVAQLISTAEHRSIRTRWVVYVFGLLSINVSLCLSALLAISIAYKWPTSPSNLLISAVVTLVVCACLVVSAKFTQVCPHMKTGCNHFPTRNFKIYNESI